jgi:hypothetical protein
MMKPKQEYVLAEIAAEKRIANATALFTADISEAKATEKGITRPAASIAAYISATRATEAAAVAEATAKAATFLAVSTAKAEEAAFLAATAATSASVKAVDFLVDATTKAAAAASASVEANTTAKKAVAKAKARTAAATAMAKAEAEAEAEAEEESESETDTEIDTDIVPKSKNESEPTSVYNYTLSSELHRQGSPEPLINSKPRRVRDIAKTKKCPCCPFSTTCKSWVNNHLILAHGPGSENMFVCGVCWAVRATQGALKSHMKTHIPVNTRACSTCNEVFTTLHSLRSHQRKHSQAKEWHCKWCQGKFANNCLLLTHMRQTHAHGLNFCIDNDHHCKGYISLISLKHHQGALEKCIEAARVARKFLLRAKESIPTSSTRPLLFENNYTDTSAIQEIASSSNTANPAAFITRELQPTKEQPPTGKNVADVKSNFHQQTTPSRLTTDRFQTKSTDTSAGGERLSSSKISLTASTLDEFGPTIRSSPNVEMIFKVERENPPTKRRRLTHTPPGARIDVTSGGNAYHMTYSYSVVSEA